MNDKNSLTVGVLMGGMSSERPVSIKSGKAVATALRNRGYQVVELMSIRTHPPNSETTVSTWPGWHCTALWRRWLHVQGMLEVMRIPYTGSSVRASAVAMDKIATKRLLARNQNQLAGRHRLAAWRPEPCRSAIPRGCQNTKRRFKHIGIHMCESQADLDQALLDCGNFESSVLIEQFIQGREITVALLEGRALPVVEIRPREGF